MPLVVIFFILVFWFLATGVVESGTNNHNVLKADLTCNINKQKI
jgi:uncharacterized membrane protein